MKPKRYKNLTAITLLAACFVLHPEITLMICLPWLALMLFQQMLLIRRFLLETEEWIEHSRADLAGMREELDGGAQSPEEIAEEVDQAYRRG